MNLYIRYRSTHPKLTWWLRKWICLRFNFSFKQRLVSSLYESSETSVGLLRIITNQWPA